MTAGPFMSSEAAMVLGLAGTAMPFARSPEEQAERWLRVLRLHGDVSAPLQALGIGEMPITATDEPSAQPASAATERDEPGSPASEPASASDNEATVKHVTALATRSAERRGAPAVATVDVLIGAMDHYGESFDRILRAYGTDRDEVLERALTGTGHVGESA